MQRVSSRERCGWLALAMVVATAVAAEEPTQWLQRMNQALTTRNYDGTFSHWHGGKVEMLRIIHRVQDGAVRLLLLRTLQTATSYRKPLPAGPSFRQLSWPTMLSLTVSSPRRSADVISSPP